MFQQSRRRLILPFIAPQLLLYLLVIFVPVALTVYYGFTDWQGVLRQLGDVRPDRRRQQVQVDRQAVAHADGNGQRAAVRCSGRAWRHARLQGRGVVCGGHA